jgi:hypothetical protein
MIDPEKLDFLCKELDKFIEDKYRPAPAKFHIIHDEEEKLNDLDAFVNTKTLVKQQSLKDVIINKMNLLGLERQDLCISALITTQYYDNLISGTKPPKARLMSLGFAFIDENLRQNNKLSMSPREIIDELFDAFDDMKYTLKETELYDVVIIFCLEEKIREIIDIDFFLNRKGLHDLSEIVLKDITTDVKSRNNKPNMIKLLLDKINSRYPINLSANINPKAIKYLDSRTEYYKSKYNIEQ